MILESYWASSINQSLKECMEADLSVTTQPPSMYLMSKSC